ncbi:hypothetical protein FPZ43_00140 [Mucilaginibacter pallidiroseus]|uniref:Secreted protein n=1 Tax=Mucilaginibacter pallidiroseus TaxID=2599295 RepID=A0A563UHT1_9SPHI|nr:hypothetical protein [Mucilaginibacter pallidiroseus]TWR30927.1 hypothetical protein FPZ43_00140 [Mucilaginibacter pallidiroseus]
MKSFDLIACLCICLVCMSCGGGSPQGTSHHHEPNPDTAKQSKFDRDTTKGNRQSSPSDAGNSSSR